MTLFATPSNPVNSRLKAAMVPSAVETAAAHAVDVPAALQIPRKKIIKLD